MVWFRWVNFPHDLLDVRSLHTTEHTQDNHKHNDKARFLHHILGGVGLVSPGGSLSAFTEGNHFAEETEADG